MKARTIEAGRIGARRVHRLGWVPVMIAAVALAGCQVNKTEPPAVTGPSELGLSLDLRVTPDVVTMDGMSQSTLTVTARNADARPVAGQGIRVEITSGGEIVDFGRLSTKNVTTGTDGRATVTYTAPNGAPTLNSDPLTVITLIATPAGSDHRSAVARQVDIRLVPQGVVLPLPYAPVAAFTVSPTEPNEGASVTFDATTSIASCIADPAEPNDVSRCTRQPGTITSYQWDFGDGQTSSGVRASIRYEHQGTYVVRLTVTNDRGLSNTVTSTVTVSGVANPTADFAFSPAAPRPEDTVFFDGSLSTAAPGRTIDRYEWNFGDGGFGSGRQPSHRFPRAASFTVTLTVRDSGGKTGTVSKVIEVGTAQ